MIYLLKMSLIIQIAFLYSDTDRKVDGISELADTYGYLLFIWSVITTIPIFTKWSFITMKNNTSPIHIDVSMF
jgi:hypothetical protein